MHITRKPMDGTQASRGAGALPRLVSGAAEMPLASIVSRNLRNSFDAATSTFWSRMCPEDGRGCFTLPMLREMHLLGGTLRSLHKARSLAGESAPFYFVSASSIPGTYNLGGDLTLFADHIRTGDRQMVGTYAHACIDVVYQNARSFDLPMVSIALIEGDALGGGLECALSHDVIVAERDAKVGFPEAMFNLFPGMGAYSFLSRRIGRAAAERLITSGKTYSAEEAFADGVVDVLAEPGQGVAETECYIRAASRRFNMRCAVFDARRRVEQVSEAELRDVVEIWADAAMRLTPADLRMMDRLASAQRRRFASEGFAPTTAISSVAGG
jgi:DSF synthase